MRVICERTQAENHWSRATTQRTYSERTASGKEATVKPSSRYQIPKALSEGAATFARDCAVVGLYPECEVLFHPKRLWRFDFAWPAEKLAVEVEGGTWANGRHNRGAGYSSDCEKYNAAVLAGWRVLRYTTEMVKAGTAIAQVAEALR
jgi:hypothetical protein